MNKCGTKPTNRNVLIGGYLFTFSMYFDPFIFIEDFLLRLQFFLSSGLHFQGATLVITSCHYMLTAHRSICYDVQVNLS
jgi:hypothetical protein